MSLVNEALRRARAQTAMQQASNDPAVPAQAPVHSPGPFAPEPTRNPAMTATFIALGVGFVIVGAWAAFALLKPGPQTAAAAAAPVATTTAPMTTPGPVATTTPADATPTRPLTEDELQAAVAAALDKHLKSEPESTPAPTHDTPAAQAVTGNDSTEAAAPSTPKDAPLTAATNAETAPPAPTPAPPKPAPKVELEGREFLGVVDEPGVPKLTLDGITWSDTASAVLINGGVATVGQSVLNVRIVKVERRRVTLQFKGQTFYLAQK